MSHQKQKEGDGKKDSQRQATNGSKSKGSGSSEDDSEDISDDSKAYKNENDEGLTYVSPLGPMSLMPAMVHDWCLALEDGQATIAILLNIKSFNMANKVLILHPAGKATAQLASPATADLNSLTLAILLQTLAQLDSDSHLAARAHVITTSPLSKPTGALSLICGEQSHIRPNILPDVDDKFLADLGISAGDAICLKKGSISWWNGHDVK
ncbi:hypothetical protein EDC04DRAFT_2599718 [Pisolithus marmoratus]|nr:hypothetical protein EDC04DRAFT_2599718 [Pisolithus marmoratus]